MITHRNVFVLAQCYLPILAVSDNSDSHNKNNSDSDKNGNYGNNMGNCV